MLFKGEINTELFKQFANATKELLSEVLIGITKEGIEYRELDSSKAALVGARLNSSAFHVFEYVGEAEENILVQVEWLAKVLKRINTDTLSIEVDKDTIAFISIGDSTKRFDGRLLSVIDKTKAKKPQFDSLTSVEIRFDAFKNAIKDISALSTHLKTEITENTLTFRGEDDAGEVVVMLDHTIHDTVHKPTGTFPTKSMYAVNYLQSIVESVSPKTEWITLQLANNKPLMINIIIEGGDILFVVAPRIEKR